MSDLLERPWQARGRCTNREPDTMFPEDDDLEAIAAAKAVCGSCLVRTECANWAEQTNPEHGIWAGQTVEERAYGGLTREQWVRARKTAQRRAQRAAKRSQRAQKAYHETEVAA